MWVRSTGLVVLLVCMAVIGCDTSDKKADAQANQPSASKRDADRPASPGKPASTHSSSNGAACVFDELIHDFGEVWAGRQIMHQFQFRNTGNATLQVPKPKAHCSCSAAQGWTREVPPGGGGVIPFKLNTANKFGPIEEYLDVRTNDRAHPLQRIRLKGTVMTVCQLEVIDDHALWAGTMSPQEVEQLKKKKGNFGRIGAADVLHRVIRLRNTSGQPLALTLVPNNRASVSLEGKRSMVELPFTVTLEEVRPGQMFDVTIVGRPPFPVGNVAASVVFTTNVPERRQYRFGLFAFVPPRIEITPYKIVHGGSRFATKRPIKITNNGTTPFKVTSVAASDPNYKVTLLPADPADPKLTEVEVLLPTGGYIPPPYGELVRIETNDAEKPVIEIWVEPAQGKPRTTRPPDKPMKLYPGKLLRG